MEPAPPTTTMTTSMKASSRENELGVRAVITMPPEASGHTGKKGADDQGLQFDREDVDSETACRHFVFADGDELPSVGRKFYFPADVYGNHQPSEDPPDIGEFIQSIKSERSARNAVHVDDQHLDYDQKAHGGHGQVMAAQPENGNADDQRGQCRCNAADEHGGEKRHMQGGEPMGQVGKEQRLF